MRIHLFLLVLVIGVGACSPSDERAAEPQPRTVVLISLDQFRWDYFTRFQPYFGEDGFRRFIESGAVLSNVSYRHAATLTCPGHAAISTGVSGNVNGIVGNDWYDTDRRQKVYCAEDDDVSLLGHSGPGRSPKLLEAQTIGDVLKQARPEAKVYTVAGKDRSAIMLAGHDADAAFWLQDSVFVTSTYYLDELPDWVTSFNERRLPQRMHGSVWNRVFPDSVYDSVQGPDDYWHEEDRQALGKTFPHAITGGSNDRDWNFYEAFRKSPFEDEILLEFVKELVNREGIGQDSISDVLGIGFSTTDRIGHPYGPDSHEVMDNVIRTDRILANLFNFLDARIGLENIVIVLTADHGVLRMPELVADTASGVWAARVSSSTMRSDVTNILDEVYGGTGAAEGWIDQYYYPHLYLNRAALLEKGISPAQAAETISTRLPEQPRYHSAVNAYDAISDSLPETYSIYPNRSGDVLIRLADHHINRNSEFGTTHGTPWEGDRHVPMLWLGRSVAHVENKEVWHVIDLAPTLTVLAGLEPPEKMQGRVVSPVVAATSE